MKRQLSLPPRARREQGAIQPLALHPNQWREIRALATEARMFPVFGEGLPSEAFSTHEDAAITPTECRKALARYNSRARSVMVPAHLAIDWDRFLRLLYWGQVYGLGLKETVR